MRRIRYVVAMSLDGYIAGPEGEADWIIIDPEVDFGAVMAQFDTYLMGRGTFEPLTGTRGGGGEKTRTFVFSRTLRQRDHPNVTIVSDNAEDTLASLRAEESDKDIWLFGGGRLFRSLLDAGLVDTVEVAIVPVLLGRGIPLLPPRVKRATLKLHGHRVYTESGIVSLEYAVVAEAGEGATQAGRSK